MRRAQTAGCQGWHFLLRPVQRVTVAALGNGWTQGSGAGADAGHATPSRPAGMALGDGSPIPFYYTLLALTEIETFPRPRGVGLCGASVREASETFASAAIFTTVAAA